eukprot:5506671-Amphidinium_carterae.1
MEARRKLCTLLLFQWNAWSAFQGVLVEALSARVHSHVSLTIVTSGIGLMLNNTLVRTYNKRSSRKGNSRSSSRLRSRGRKPDHGPLFSHQGARSYAPPDKRGSNASTLRKAQGAHVHWYLRWPPRRHISESVHLQIDTFNVPFINGLVSVHPHDLNLSGSAV